VLLLLVVDVVGEHAERLVDDAFFFDLERHTFSLK